MSTMQGRKNRNTRLVLVNVVSDYVCNVTLIDMYKESKGSPIETFKRGDFFVGKDSQGRTTKFILDWVYLHSNGTPYVLFQVECGGTNTTFAVPIGHRIREENGDIHILAVDTFT